MVSPTTHFPDLGFMSKENGSPTIMVKVSVPVRPSLSVTVAWIHSVRVKAIRVVLTEILIRTVSLGLCLEKQNIRRW